MKPETIYAIRNCKNLARVIKAQRKAPPVLPSKIDLPSKDIADRLVDYYLRCIENIYRVLHIPTFRKNYDALWSSEVELDTAFLIQVKLVLAIGAATYDDVFSLRNSATRWVYEAQTWASEPEAKKRLSLQALQNNILLLLARETTGIGESLICISAGSLLRAAVYMGLHRDPVYLPKRTILAAEMRRRIWNTILEMNLQSSMSSGGPPFISLDDFDTEPPGNFDDDQLLAEDPTPKPPETFTQTSVAIVLQRTFPVRLQIAKFLNNLGSRGTYEETLRLTATLKDSYKTLSRTL